MMFVTQVLGVEARRRLICLLPDELEISDFDSGEHRISCTLALQSQLFILE